MKEHTQMLIDDMAKHEKKIVPSRNINNNELLGDISEFRSKLKTGIEATEFFKLLKIHTIKLNNEEKVLLSEIFTLPEAPNYFDIESLCKIFEDAIRNTAGDVQAIGSENLSHLWEKKIYKEIGEFLKKNNITIEMAFKILDQDHSGFISFDEWQGFIGSLGLELSLKDIQMLFSMMKSNKKGQIPLSSFKKKFWEAYVASVIIKLYKLQSQEQLVTEMERKIEDIKYDKRKLISSVIASLKKLSNNNPELCWAMLDVRKIGYMEAKDLRKGLLNLGVIVTIEESGYLFTFIDSNKDIRVNQFEFYDFWL